MNIKLRVLLVATVFGLGLPQYAAAQSFARPGATTSAIHIPGPNLNSFDNYGSGNDDAFAEYGLTTFNFTAADFGGPVTSIEKVLYNLTVNDRSFSDGDSVEVFFTPDSEADLGGLFANLSYNAGLINGIDGTQYVTAPVSLGVFAIPEMAGRAGGEVDTLLLPFTGAAEAALVSAINSGADFQLIVAATDAADDITYSGVGNTFDPGDPLLRITVPEPGVGLMLLLGLGGGMTLFRRR